MSQYASTTIPKPKNWQDFEGHTCVLFRCILGDPNTSTHGRGGQAQQGVDVYGRRDRRDNHWLLFKVLGSGGLSGAAQPAGGTGDKVFRALRGLSPINPSGGRWHYPSKA